MTTYGLKNIGIHNPGQVYRNLPATQLVEFALERGEGFLAPTGALSVNTGKYTGRSPHDKFVVDSPAVHDEIWWGPNQPIAVEKFINLYNRLTAYLQNRDIFIFDGFAGADTTYRLPIRVVNEFAWQNMFVQNLFIRPTAEELGNHTAEYTVICAPGFKAIPEIDGTNSEAFVMLNFEQKVIIIGGTHYAGEMKKSIFTVMNYLLPKRGVFPMHCSANTNEAGNVALFFGLSGTGKTTLSADPKRNLIGDDEHGWSNQGVFNFEGGCYAKCIKLSQENEPQIWEAIRFGAVLENVDVDPVNRTVDFDSERLTENTRAAYPLHYIPGAVIPSVGGQPATVVFLTADAFGVLPPIAKLTKEQAMYHFLSGYTSKLAGTERGITSPETTFSTCFGSPFLPLHPRVYADLLGEKIDKYDANVYLINTGWSGGPYGVGKRMSIKHTRAMVNAALEKQLDNVNFYLDPIFNVLVPESCSEVPAEMLNPRNTWADKAAYDKAAKDLAARFVKNFAKFDQVPKTIVEAGPKAE
jgi:phosphoenolpyruvate carboxykinase (ATP)